MIVNCTRETVLARQPRVATAAFTRMRGMLGRRFDDFDAMVFPRCNAIHMCFMGMALDVVFVDENGLVVALFPALRPWRFAGAKGASTTLELPVGALADSQTALGDRLSGPGLHG
jgi:uncharacterized protein